MIKFTGIKFTTGCGKYIEYSVKSGNYHDKFGSEKYIFDVTFNFDYRLSNVFGLGLKDVLQGNGFISSDEDPSMVYSCDIEYTLLMPTIHGWCDKKITINKFRFESLTFYDGNITIEGQYEPLQTA